MKELEELLAAAEDNAPVNVAPMPVRKDKFVSVPVNLLKEAVNKNPEHPVAQVYKKSLAGRPDDFKVVVSQTDLRALMEDLEVLESKTTTSDGRVSRTTITKSLGAKIKKSPVMAASKGNKEKESV